MPLNMPPVGQGGINPLILQALMQQGGQGGGIGGPQLPQPAMRPSGGGMNGGGYTMTGPAPQQPAKPGVGGMLQNPMQMAQMGQILKGMNAPPLPIGAASGAPMGGIAPQGASFLPGSVDLSGLSGGTAGGMDIGGALGQGYAVGAPSYGSLGGMNFGGGLTAPSWGTGTGANGLMGSMFGGGGADAGAAAIGGDAALGGGAALAGGGAADGIMATIMANPEIWALMV